MLKILFIFGLSLLVELSYFGCQVIRKREMEKRDAILKEMHIYENEPSFIEVLTQSKPKEELIAWKKHGMSIIEKYQAKPGMVIWTFLIPIVLFICAFGFLYHWMPMNKQDYLILISAILTFINTFSKEKWKICLFSTAVSVLIGYEITGSQLIFYFGITLIAFLTKPIAKKIKKR